MILENAPVYPWPLQEPPACPQDNIPLYQMPEAAPQPPASASCPGKAKGLPRQVPTSQTLALHQEIWDTARRFGDTQWASVSLHWGTFRGPTTRLSLSTRWTLFLEPQNGPFRCLKSGILLCGALLQ